MTDVCIDRFMSLSLKTRLSVSPFMDSKLNASIEQRIDSRELYTKKRREDDSDSGDGRVDDGRSPEVCFAGDGCFVILKQRGKAKKRTKRMGKNR
ncbi:hypothetical protein VNO77_24086 [Canavalia gladiata]|uniref:Uncharacterized protein n=1 Tax=Canavalia gladiata TaxID=3824 RepID=A0AAN9L901_CANGL